MSDAVHWDNQYRTIEYLWKTEPNRVVEWIHAACPPNPAVLHTPNEVQADVANAAVPDLVIDRAERRPRPVATDARTATAVDCLVRVHPTQRKQLSP